LLAGDEGLPEVQAQLAQAQALGIQSVPTFVVNDRYAIQGAQPPEAFAQALRQIAADMPEAPAAAQGGQCDVDGCP
jgi:predicted DsbA family dithiol-disulfide isomerase